MRVGVCVGRGFGMHVARGILVAVGSAGVRVGVAVATVVLVVVSVGVLVCNAV